MSDKNKKKLILATGIFPPDIGGPSTYVFELAKELTIKGWEIVVVAYGDEGGANLDLKVIKISRKQNIIFRYLKYFLAVLKYSKNAQAVYVFDLVSSGIPGVLAAALRRKKTLARLGGDFLWEKAFSQNWTDLPLEKYYKQKKSFKEKVYFFLNKIFLKIISKIVFTTSWTKKIYKENYKIKEKKSVIIKNPFPSVQKDLETKKDVRKKIIFAGRLIKLKNLDRVIKAIVNIKELKFDIYGEGPEKENLQVLINDLDLADRVSVNKKLKHKDFMRKLQSAYLVIVPSITEVSPNTVLECIKLGVPVIATKEGGFFDYYKDNLIFIDPMNTEDVRKKLHLILKRDVYEAYRESIKSIDSDRSFKDVAGEVEGLLNSL